MAGKASGAFLGGLVLGSTVGALAGLLLAPRTGRETRRILRKSADALPELAEDLSASLALHADHISDTALQNWEHTLQRLRLAIAAGQAASQAEYETLSDRAVPDLEAQAGPTTPQE
ncbi:gas vesicle protein [filamentous cyanobacterium CCP5]|nr:gas vesicle protein [filamentous cyanobacterium CCP5]